MLGIPASESHRALADPLVPQCIIDMCIINTKSSSLPLGFLFTNNVELAARLFSLDNEAQNHISDRRRRAL